MLAQSRGRGGGTRIRWRARVPRRENPQAEGINGRLDDTEVAALTHHAFQKGEVA